MRLGWLLPVLLALVMSALARADLVVTPAAPSLAQTWPGAGNIVFTQNFCLRSTNGASNSGRAYSFTPSAPFTLSNGSSTLPFTATWRGTNNAVSNLTAGVALVNLPGSGAVCPGGNNTTLTVTVPAASLLASPAGLYTRVLQLTFDNAQAAPIVVPVTLSVSIGSYISLSQLTDINLGAFDGVNPLSGTDTVCVYRNVSGGYGVRATGQGAGGAFVLANGASQVSFGVSWNDGTGAVALTPGALLSGRTNVNTTSLDCNAGTANNATLGVTISAANMGAASATGLHTGTLTLTLELQ